jgi:hypothetical protein
MIMQILLNKSEVLGMHVNFIQILRRMANENVLRKRRGHWSPRR